MVFEPPFVLAACERLSNGAHSSHSTHSTGRSAGTSATEPLVCGANIDDARGPLPLPHPLPPPHTLHCCYATPGAAATDRRLTAVVMTDDCGRIQQQRLLPPLPCAHPPTSSQNVPACLQILSAVLQVLPGCIPYRASIQTTTNTQLVCCSYICNS